MTTGTVREVDLDSEDDARVMRSVKSMVTHDKMKFMFGYLTHQNFSSAIFLIPLFRIPYSAF